MKNLKLLIIILPIFLFTGCFNYHELNQLAITSAIGIDKDEDGYRVTIQVLNTQKTGSESNSSIDQPKFVNYTTVDKNLQEALRKVLLDSSKRIYASHLQILVLGSELAEDGIYNVLDLFFRNSESRKQFYVLVAKDSKAEDLLSVVTSLETQNSKNIRDSLLIDSRYLGVGEIVTFEQMLDSYLNSNKEIVLPTFEIIGDPKKGDSIENVAESDPKVTIKSSSLAVFKNDKMLGDLSQKDSIALGFIRGKIHNTVLSYECSKDKYVVAEVIDTKTDVKMQTDPLKAQINISGRLNINEVVCNLDLEDTNVIVDIEKNLEKELKNSIEHVIDKVSKDYNTDVFGFGDTLYKSNPKYFNKIKDKWYDEIFPNLDYEIKVDFDLVEKGNGLKVIKR